MWEVELSKEGDSLKNYCDDYLKLKNYRLSQQQSQTKVKTFTSIHYDGMDADITEFIKDKTLVDIKLNSMLDDSGPNTKIYFIAMVIYRENENI